MFCKAFNSDNCFNVSYTYIRETSHASLVAKFFEESNVVESQLVTIYATLFSILTFCFSGEAV